MFEVVSNQGSDQGTLSYLLDSQHAESQPEGVKHFRIVNAVDSFCALVQIFVLGTLVQHELLPELFASLTCSD